MIIDTLLDSGGDANCWFESSLTIVETFLLVVQVTSTMYQALDCCA